MDTNLAYGETGLPLELPDSLQITVIEPRFVDIILCCALGTHRPNPEAELRTMFATSATPEVAEWLLAN